MIAIAAASLAVGLLTPILVFAAKMGGLQRDNEAVKEMVGMGKNKAAFLRWDVANERFTALQSKIEEGEKKIDTLLQDTKALREDVSEIKVMVAKQGS
ncbi:MAG TPA: hypothetical protein VGQ73_04510 [Gemmatimonadales bacterium]|nr:hypothetical protein [Gemmatimonadales bacterium]